MAFHIFILGVLFFLPINQASSLTCWSPINTTSEPSSKFINFQVINNDLYAIYNNTLIRSWQFQTGHYISEKIINSTQTITSTHSLPDTSKVVLVYKSGLIEIRDFESNYQLEAKVMATVPFLKILPLQNTRFLYILKDTHLEKWTIAGEKILDIYQDGLAMKEFRLFKDLIYIPNSENLVSWSTGNYLQIWSTKTDRYLKEWNINFLLKDDDIECIYYYPPMDVLLVGTSKGNIKFYNYNIGTVEFGFQAFAKEEVKQIHVFDEYIAVVSRTNKIKIYRGKKIFREIDLALNSILDFQMGFDQKGLLLGYIGSMTTIKTWRVNFFSKEKNKCWDTCPKGTFVKEFDCEACALKCEECQNSNICLKCTKDFYNDEGKCVKSCGYFKSEEEDGTCKQRMISFSNAFLAGLLFIGMELVRKFWKQIRSYIQRVVFFIFFTFFMVLNSNYEYFFSYYCFKILENVFNF